MRFDSREKDAKMDAEEAKRKLASGHYALAAPTTKENHEPICYVKHKRCNILLKYDSKMTGNSSLIRHVDRSCSTLACVQDQPTIK